MTIGLSTMIMTVIYAIGHFIVYNVQKKQFDGLKSQMQASTTYAQTFDPAKVKGYTELVEDNARHEALNLLYNQPKMQAALDVAIGKHTADLHALYIEEMGKEHSELFTLAVNVIIQNKDDKHNLNLILNKLPTAREKLLCAVKESGVDLPDTIFLAKQNRSD